MVSDKARPYHRQHSPTKSCMTCKNTPSLPAGKPTPPRVYGEQICPEVQNGTDTYSTFGKSKFDYAKYPEVCGFDKDKTREGRHKGDKTTRTATCTIQPDGTVKKGFEKATKETRIWMRNSLKRHKLVHAWSNKWKSKLIKPRQRSKRRGQGRMVCPPQKLQKQKGSWHNCKKWQENRKPHTDYYHGTRKQ